MALNGTSHPLKAAETVKFDDLDVIVQTLLRKATDARELAYAPYSNFKVGAAVELEDGSTVTGCNIENASFTVGTCAERCALFKAISEGKKRYRRIAVVAYQERGITSPCGACRQLMNEFGDFEVYLSKPDLREVVRTSVHGLLPLGFHVNADYTF
ncbi:cytidine deaminase-like [Atheta coriaria]|uniref:cytidine deaminase-like n=1 Tax=Dalotia coriaria TaxID=877792 RepID=UPI0031F34C3B